MCFKLSFWGDRKHQIDVEHFEGAFLGSLISMVIWNSTLFEGGAKKGPSQTLASVRLGGGQYELERYDRRKTTIAVVASQRQREEASVISGVPNFAFLNNDLETAEPWPGSRSSICILRTALLVVLCSSQDIHLNRDTKPISLWARREKFLSLPEKFSNRDKKR